MTANNSMRCLNEGNTSPRPRQRRPSTPAPSIAAAGDTCRYFGRHMKATQFGARTRAISTSAQKLVAAAHSGSANRARILAPGYSILDQRLPSQKSRVHDCVPTCFGHEHAQLGMTTRHYSHDRRDGSQRHDYALDGVWLFENESSLSPLAKALAKALGALRTLASTRSKIRGFPLDNRARSSHALYI